MRSIVFPFVSHRNGPFRAVFGPYRRVHRWTVSHAWGTFCPPGARLAPRTHRLVFARALIWCRCRTPQFPFRLFSHELIAE